MWPELGLWQCLGQGEKAEVTRCLLGVQEAVVTGLLSCSVGRGWTPLVLSEAELYCELDGVSAGRNCPGGTWDCQENLPGIQPQEEAHPRRVGRAVPQLLPIPG